MCTVSGAESVHYEYLTVNQISKLLGEAFAVLGLVSASESGVLEENNVAVSHFGNSLLSVVAYNSVISSKCNLCAGENFFKSLCYGSKGELSLGTVLGLAEMRTENDLSAVGDKLLDSGEGSLDTVVVSDNAVLEGNVEVASYENLFALNVNVVNSDFV